MSLSIIDSKAPIEFKIYLRSIEIHRFTSNRRAECVCVCVCACERLFTFHLLDFFFRSFLQSNQLLLCQARFTH